MEEAMNDEIEIKIEYTFVPQNDPLASPTSDNEICGDFESELDSAETCVETTGLPIPNTCEWKFSSKPIIEDNTYKEENVHVKQTYTNDEVPSIRREVVTWYKEIDKDGKLYCKFCELSYSVVQTLRYHVRTKHPAEAMLLKEAIAKASRCHKIMCHICNVKYHSLDELKDHVRLKHRIDKDEKFISKFFHSSSSNNKNNENQKHSNNKDDLRKFPCPYCAHVAKRNYGLKTHIKARHKSEQDLTYQCPYCSYKASIKYYLQNHIATKHPDSEYARSKVSYLCDVCCYRTPRKSHFLAHTKSHFTTEKKHKCEYCDYSTNLIANLEVHRRTHTKEKPYLCDIDGCEYRCSAKTALNSHRLKHEPEKHLLYCDKCNYKTIYRHALKKHTESHERRFNMDDRRIKGICKYS